MGVNNVLLETARSLFMKGSINMASDTIKASLIDVAAIPSAKAVTSTTAATPPVVSCTAHGWANGTMILIVGASGAGATAINGRHIIANQSTNQFELTDYGTGANVNATAGTTSGGYAIPIGHNESGSDVGIAFWDDISAAEIDTAETLGSKTTDQGEYGGVFDAADETFAAVSGATVEAIAIWKDTTTPSTSPVIFLITSGSNLPVTPNGGDINVAWNSGYARIGQI